MPSNTAPYTAENDTVAKKLPPDVPRFVLSGTDPSAPAAVQCWIDSNIKRLGHDHPKILRALATRDAMMQWPTTKLPD
jgi:hypothetical protein